MDDLLDDAAIEFQDDDYYDVDSEDEANNEVVGDLGVSSGASSSQSQAFFDQDGHIDPLYGVNVSVNAAGLFHLQSKAPSAQTPSGRVPLGQKSLLTSEYYRPNFGLTMPSLDSSGHHAHRHDSFAYNGLLDHYRPECAANPLRNEHTARVFAHFVHSTGPSLSIFERNTITKLSGRSGLWTRTLPMLALQHQGLLQAMLALASLHISRLQGASATPSFKHYAYALKHVHHCVASARKRHLITTIAATLLLGYYEVMMADHLKWNSHLLGVKQLLGELDLRGMSNEYRRQRNWNNSGDDEFLRVLTGRHDDERSEREQHQQQQQTKRQQIIEQQQQQQVPKLFDMQSFEVLQDLFWWYCKQDVYQSVVSGNDFLYVRPFILPPIQLIVSSPCFIA